MERRKERNGQEAGQRRGTGCFKHRNKRALIGRPFSFGHKTVPMTTGMTRKPGANSRKGRVGREKPGTNHAVTT